MYNSITTINNFFRAFGLDVNTLEVQFDKDAKVSHASGVLSKVVIDGHHRIRSSYRATVDKHRHLYGTEVKIDGDSFKISRP
jgi:hypothetical protein